MYPRLTRLALPLPIGPALLIGCGDAPQGADARAGDTTTSPSRIAATDGQWPETLTCPETTDSSDLTVTVKNLTQLGLRTRAGDIDCYDWSGTATPPSLLNIYKIPAGASRKVTLRRRNGTDNNWRMRFYNSEGFVGEIRVQKPKSAPQLLINQAQTGTLEGGALHRCRPMEMQPAPGPQAGERRLPPRTDNPYEISVYVSKAGVDEGHYTSRDGWYTAFVGEADTCDWSKISRG